MSQDSLPRGSLAATPDLGWSQVRETVLMLELAAGQVDAAMKDSNSSVEVLTDTFTSLAETLGLIEAAVATLPDTVGNGMVKSEIQENTRVVTQKVHQAIIAFQFYDKLVQRLDHVCHCLGSLSGLVGDNGRLYNPEEWVGLQDAIKSKYTMLEEHEMFAAVLAGMPVAEAIEQFMNKREEATASGGDIELF
jgi:predicted methyltransferase MtxX (methanogen marker protein 4)